MTILTTAATRRQSALHLLGLRAMDGRYFPSDINEAHDIIDYLRQSLEVFTAPMAVQPRMYGMTKKQWQFYQCLKNLKGGLISKRRIFSTIYGFANDASDIKIIDVLLSHCRKKLPPDERIETVWGKGLRWVRVDTEANSA